MTLHEAFIKFNDSISISNAKKDSIIRSRNAVRDKIRNFFKDELHENIPKFQSQGSFVINTALNPLPDNEVDIDDGLYLNNIDSNNNSTWMTPKEIHSIIMNALEGHTQDGCEDKTSCVRVVYKKNYHIDIPIYIMKDGHALLANKKTNEWVASDSKDFKDWFYKNRKNDQTSRLVRYLKAWRDFQNFDFSSIELTILVINHHKKDANDALALKNTLDSIISSLNFSRKIKKPVSPFEDLWEELSDIEKHSRMDKLQSLRDDLSKAINSPTVHRASIILQEIFGDRFPLVEDNSSTNIKSYSIGAKPWGL